GHRFGWQLGQRGELADPSRVDRCAVQGGDAFGGEGLDNQVDVQPGGSDAVVTQQIAGPALTIAANPG
ncbi:MAG: hypothetical protein M3Y77_04380, partial [Actinomycetota bacterium]|nr:hypothetical protein [Actinomycetota bacterium]